MEIRTVAVIGAGTMGSGIAQVLALSGYRVLLRDLEPVRIDRALQSISARLEREVSKQKLTLEERDQVLRRIEPGQGLAEVALSDCVIEAISEKFSAKAGLLRDLDALCRPEVIFASNTSSIPSA